MTSNIGSSYLLDGVNPDGSIDEEAREMVMNEMKRTFRPEFLNRVDEIVMFKPLQRNEIFKIIDIQIDDLRFKLVDRQIEIEVTDAAKELILDRSYSSQYGARPVKRYIQKEIETNIGRMLIKGDLKDKEILSIDSENGELKFSKK